MVGVEGRETLFGRGGVGVGEALFTSIYSTYQSWLHVTVDFKTHLEALWFTLMLLDVAQG